MGTESGNNGPQVVPSLGTHFGTRLGTHFWNKVGNHLGVMLAPIWEPLSLSICVRNGAWYAISHSLQVAQNLKAIVILLSGRSLGSGANWFITFTAWCRHEWHDVRMIFTCSFCNLYVSLP